MKIRIAAVAALAATACTATVAGASQPTPTVPPHQHYIVTAEGDRVPVGPNACEDGMSVQFDNFHTKIHRGQPYANGIVSASGCP